MHTMKKLILIAPIVLAVVLFITMFRPEDKIEKLNDAIRSDNYAKIESLLANLSGEEIDEGAAKASYHPLVLACEKGNDDVVNMLLEKNVDVNYREDVTGDTPITATLGSNSDNRFSIAQLLIEKGADVNAVNNYGFSPFTLVLDKRASDNERTKEEQIQLFKYLYDNADIQTCLDEYPEKTNEFVMAVDKDSPAAAEWMMQQGKFSQEDIPSSQGSKLRYLYNLDDDGNLTSRTEMVEYVVNHGIEDINKTDNSGKTILMTAAEAEDAEACELFLSLGADKTMRDNAGKTAYDYAAKYNSGELDKLLR